MSGDSLAEHLAVHQGHVIIMTSPQLRYLVGDGLLLLFFSRVVFVRSAMLYISATLRVSILPTENKVPAGRPMT